MYVYAYIYIYIQTFSLQYKHTSRAKEINLGQQWIPHAKEIFPRARGLSALPYTLTLVEKSRPPRTSWTAARTIAPGQSWRIRRIKIYWLLCCSCWRYGEWANTFQKNGAQRVINGAGHMRTGVVMQRGISRKYGEARSVEVLQHHHHQQLMYRIVEMAFPTQGWVGLTFLRTGKGQLFSMHVFSFSRGLKVSTSTTIRRK